jgi:outer membrane receptor for Fe3+-dicitrate
MWMRPGGVRNSSNPAGHYAHIFVDGAPYGSMESMRTFRVTNVQEIRFVAATDATVRYGGQFQGGVLLITTKR